VAAAARRDDPYCALEEIRDKLAALQAHCQSPCALERDIQQARADDQDLASAVQEYQETLLPPASRAARAALQNLEDCLDAFYDYVQLRGDRTDDEHMIGRVRMAQFLRVAVEDMTDHFGAS
jgi:hypothetical protein